VRDYTIEYKKAIGIFVTPILMNIVLVLEYWVSSG